MAALFSGPPKVRIPPPPPPPPQIDDAAQSQDLANQLARRRGRLATLKSMSGTYGASAAAPSVAVKTLLG